jgi:acyl-coenzyme A synthetase/AMP-(fatty) acid ligase
MPSHPLVSHSSPDQIIAWRDGAPVRVGTFLADVARVAAALPDGSHVFNACRDRYRFAVGLCAALVAEKISLLPSMHTPETVRQLAAFAPDVFCLHDTQGFAIELPSCHYPEPGAGNAVDLPEFAVPRIESSRTMAYIFTSGSTGTPVPHRKTWGNLVDSARAAATRLGLLDSQPYTIIGTVPPQHMYGFESTVLLALAGGFAFSNRQPFYPADIREAIDQVPQPRILVTSPLHLHALLASSEDVLPRMSLILSATAVLDKKLAQEAEERLDAPLIEIYGSTETGQIATRHTIREVGWQLFPNIHLDMRDDDGDPTAWISGGHIEEPMPMGDVLEQLDDTRFLLHDRKANLINIAGKRTSLAYLNHQLNAIPGVVDGVFFMPDNEHGSAVTRLVALVVAPGLSAASVRRALRERIDAAFLPRPLLFVDALPRNEVGKLPRDQVATLVKARMRAIHDIAATVPESPKSITIPLTIPEDHPALPGHFPGRPVVPGVVLLNLVMDAIGEALARRFDTWRLSWAKFPNPVKPGEVLTLAFESVANGDIRFTLHAGAREVASGVLASPQRSSDEARP